MKATNRVIMCFCLLTKRMKSGQIFKNIEKHIDICKNIVSLSGLNYLDVKFNNKVNYVFKPNKLESFVQPVD